MTRLNINLNKVFPRKRFFIGAEIINGVISDQTIELTYDVQIENMLIHHCIINSHNGVILTIGRNSHVSNCELHRVALQQDNVTYGSYQ